MRKVALLLVFACLSSWATTIDTCKIEVKRTVDGFFDISAVTDNVYVRKGNKLDRTNYVYLTDTLLEIICTDTHIINLKNGHQEGKVTCWSQKPKDAAPVPDIGDFHQLAPMIRRNWLKLNGINVNTHIKMSICDDEGGIANINIRKCIGWNREKVTGNYMLEGGTNSTLKWTTDLDKYQFSPIILKEGEKLQQITLKKNNQLIQVNSILLNYKSNIPLYEDSRDLNEDDIVILDGEITADLSKVALTDPSQTIDFECTALTDQGPRNIQIIVPVEIGQNSSWLARVLWIVIPLAVIALLFFILWKFRFIGIIRKSLKKSIKNTPIDKGTIPTLVETKEQEEKDKETSKTNAEAVKNNADPIEIKPTIQNGKNQEAKLTISDEETKEIKKKLIRQIIDEWNVDHPENMVNINQIGIDSLFRTISQGYIVPTGKQLLEQSINKYGVKNDESKIDANVIQSLLIAYYNKGSMDATSAEALKSDSSAKKMEEFNKRLGQLTYEKAQLEKEKKTIEEEKNRLHTELEKLCEDFETIKNDNTKQIGIVEEQGKKIEELEQQVSAQSQEHVDELVRRIEQLDKNIAYAQNVIIDKDREITAEQEKYRKLAIQKEEWINKYNKVKAQFDEVESKHQEAISKLMSDHQEAKLKQKDKYERQISDIKAEMDMKQEEYKAELGKQNADYEAQLKRLHDEAEISMQQLKEEQEGVISTMIAKHKGEIDKLNATVKELGVSVNIGRDDMIKNADKLLEAISADLVNMNKSVNSVVNQLPIFVNSIHIILTEVRLTRDDLDEAKVTDWSKPDKLQAQVMQDMQDIFINALNRTGWMNNVARLLSYSRLPKLHDGFDLPAELEAHGISTAILERIYSNMVSLLGIAHMGILVPAVLANHFDKDNYEYKNGDTWIDRFFPEVSTRNYKGKVFDIVQVGYTIEGITEKKPVVQYN